MTTITRALRDYAKARLLLACDAAAAALTTRAQVLRERRRQRYGPQLPKPPVSGAAAMMRLMERRRDPWYGDPYYDDVA